LKKKTERNPIKLPQHTCKDILWSLNIRRSLMTSSYCKKQSVSQCYSVREERRPKTSCTLQLERMKHKIITK